MSRPPGPMVHLHSLWRWAFGRSTERNAMATPTPREEDRLTITPSMFLHETVSWLRLRGYQAVPGTGPGVMGGILYGRKNQPACIAMVGDVLIWDGQNVKIEE